MNTQQLENWLAEHKFGLYLSRLEQQFILHKLTGLRFGTILQCGISQWQFQHVCAVDSQYIIQSNIADSGTAVIAECKALPWAQQSIDTIIWPHGLDTLSDYEDSIAEIARVLVPGGHLVMTGLNIHGYWRLFYQSSLKGHSALKLLSARTAVDKMQRFGLFLEEGQFMGYGIPACYGDSHKAIEYMGNRWWPHLAAVYGLVLVKRTVPLTLTAQNANMLLNPAPSVALKSIE